ncbi:hypothetical protein [Streptomyces sp. OE57]|uniref:hypothetical protein n=1 Tax=Streptomyces lacaronensis TaxID=3379885 RepID=UPI0039B74528
MARRLTELYAAERHATRAREHASASWDTRSPGMAVDAVHAKYVASREAAEGAARAVQLLASAEPPTAMWWPGGPSRKRCAPPRTGWTSPTAASAVKRRRRRTTRRAGLRRRAAPHIAGPRRTERPRVAPDAAEEVVARRARGLYKPVDSVFSPQWRYY